MWDFLDVNKKVTIDFFVAICAIMILFMALIFAWCGVWWRNRDCDRTSWYEYCNDILLLCITVFYFLYAIFRFLTCFPYHGMKCKHLWDLIGILYFGGKFFFLFFWYGSTSSYERYALLLYSMWNNYRGFILYCRINSCDC